MAIIAACGYKYKVFYLCSILFFTIISHEILRAGQAACSLWLGHKAFAVLPCANSPPLAYRSIDSLALRALINACIRCCSRASILTG